MMLQWHRLVSGTHYEVQGIIEDFLSVVWTERWQEYGDAQIVIPKTHDVRTGDLVTNPERSMAVEVVGRMETEKTIELRCVDALSILDRRIAYPTVTNDGLISTFITKLIAPYLTGSVSQQSRWLRPLRMGDISAVTGSSAIQRTYSHVGSIMVELGSTYNFNPTMRLTGGLLYLGAETNNTTRVWGVGRYLSGYREDSDTSDYKTLAYVGLQEDSGGNRIVKEVYSGGAPVNMIRRETFVDRRDLSVSGLDITSFEDAYGSITVYGSLTLTPVTEGMGSSAVVVDLSFEAKIWAGDITAKGAIPSLLRATNNDSLVSQMIALASPSARTYTGSFVTASDGWRVGIEGTYVIVPASMLDYAALSLEDTSVTRVIRDIGQRALSDMSIETVFEAFTEGLTPYVDYSLGDTVTVYKEDGASRTGIIREVVESWDDGGYRATPSLAMQ